MAAETRQLTQDPRNHDLDNNQNFTRDGKWLIYDTRNPGIPESKTIERIHVESGQVEVLYEAEKGAMGPALGAGAASFSPTDDRVAFIHGPWKSTGLEYAFTCRRGGLVNGDGRGGFAFADARDITPPFTPGALRGGTHRHEWDATGKWLGYTYNDEIMKRAGKDLRTIGVTWLGKPVTVSKAKEGLFEGDGEGFSVLVVKVTENPRPGSDEISRAAQDMWVGAHGRLKPDGSHQRARAFVGTVRSSKGENIDELFIVDIPDDITQPGPDGPLEGTERDFPMPPMGCSQRRLTRTEKSAHPGVVGNCWSSPDGNWITFLAKDESGVQQIFGIHPAGGDPVQLTALPEGVACSPRWSPDGKQLVAVSGEGRLFTHPAPGVVGMPAGAGPTFLTEPVEGPSAPTKPAISPDGKTIAFNRLLKSGDSEWMQIFVVGLGD
ncbi:MAG: hypothetical protein GHCLOJNM_02633 [bacterium]|nr:hypothetical protein [bacterium]